MSKQSELLTGKCKEDFEKWYDKFATSSNHNPLTHWDELYKFDLHPFEMQSGVYLAFFDSVDLKIDISPYRDDDRDEGLIWRFDWDVYVKFEYATCDIEGYSRTEALKEAIKKANEIYNEETNT